MDTNQTTDAIAATTVNNLNNYEVSLFGDVESTTASADILNSQADLLNNGGNIYITMLIYLGAIILIVAGLLFLRKYLINRLGYVKNGSYMRILDRLIISQDKQIVLIELKNKILITGITQQRIETLCEFDRSELDIIEQDDTDNTDSLKNGGNFIKMLGNKLNTANKSDENVKK